MTDRIKSKLQGKKSKETEENLEEEEVEYVLGQSRREENQKKV